MGQRLIFMHHMISWRTNSTAAHSHTQCTSTESLEAKSSEQIRQGTAIAGDGMKADGWKADLILLLVVHVGLQSSSHGRHMMLRYRQVHHVLVSGAPAAHPQLIKHAWHCKDFWDITTVNTRNKALWIFP